MSTLTQAAADGDVVEMRRIIASGETVNATRGDGATPLLLAALGAHAEACRVLLDAGAELDTPKDTGATALFAAAASDSPEAIDCVTLLLAAGAAASRRRRRRK